MRTPLSTTGSEQFIVGESDLNHFLNHPCKLDCGVILLCRSGQADIQMNLRTSLMTQHCEVLLPPGAIIMTSAVSPDFKVSFFSFSLELFNTAVYKLDPSLFLFLNNNPIHKLNQESLFAADLWMRRVEHIYDDRENMFRNTIIKNLLQNMFLDIYDKACRNKLCNYDEEISGSRQLDLFHRFVSLLHEHCRQHREVGFYADKLCISTRYLSAVVHNVAQESAKEIIDRCVLLEIKVMLQSTTLTIQEIADRLHFPDQSYLGRYFKRHTGITPSQYRNQK